jgi:hypothetical protein
LTALIARGRPFTGTRNYPVSFTFCSDPCAFPTSVYLIYLYNTSEKRLFFHLHPTHTITILHFSFLSLFDPQLFFWQTCTTVFSFLMVASPRVDLVFFTGDEVDLPTSLRGIIVGLFAINAVLSVLWQRIAVPWLLRWMADRVRAINAPIQIQSVIT